MGVSTELKPVGESFDAPFVRVQETNPVVEYTGPDHTWNDQQDMRRLGKKQELRVRFLPRPVDQHEISDKLL